MDTFIHFLWVLPTMNQVFTLRNIRKQLVECFVVLNEALKMNKSNNLLQFQTKRKLFLQRSFQTLTLCEPVPSVLSKLLQSSSNVCDLPRQMH